MDRQTFLGKYYFRCLLNSYVMGTQNLWKLGTQYLHNYFNIYVCPSLRFFPVTSHFRVSLRSEVQMHSQISAAVIPKKWTQVFDATDTFSFLRPRNLSKQMQRQIWIALTLKYLCKIDSNDINSSNLNFYDKWWKKLSLVSYKRNCVNK